MITKDEPGIIMCGCCFNRLEIWEEEGKLVTRPLRVTHIEITRISYMRETTGNTCPECGGITVFGEGCVKCQSCGWSAC